MMISMQAFKEISPTVRVVGKQTGGSIMVFLSGPVEESCPATTINIHLTAEEAREFAEDLLRAATPPLVGG